MKTILAIDLGKRNSVFCRLETSSLKPEYFKAKTGSEKFHNIFAELDGSNSIVLFDVGSQAVPPLTTLAFCTPSKRATKTSTEILSASSRLTE